VVSRDNHHKVHVEVDNSIDSRHAGPAPVPVLVLEAEFGSDNNPAHSLHEVFHDVAVVDCVYRLQPETMKAAVVVDIPVVVDCAGAVEGIVDVVAVAGDSVVLHRAISEGSERFGSLVP
jgi:hypothetical protein